MRIFKINFICFIFILFIFSAICPFYIYASDDVSFVWSELSSPIVTTSTVLSQGER